MVQYPAEFSCKAKDCVEAEKIKAWDDLEKRITPFWNVDAGLPSKLYETVVPAYIIQVVQVFAG